eukprot:3405380-Amphidinium_carterae.1
MFASAPPREKPDWYDGEAHLQQPEDNHFSNLCESLWHRPFKFEAFKTGNDHSSLLTLIPRDLSQEKDFTVYKIFAGVRTECRQIRAPRSEFEVWRDCLPSHHLPMLAARVQSQQKSLQHDIAWSSKHFASRAIHPYHLSGQGWLAMHFERSLLGPLKVAFAV